MCANLSCMTTNSAELQSRYEDVYLEILDFQARSAPAPVRIGALVIALAGMTSVPAAPAHQIYLVG